MKEDIPIDSNKAAVQNAGWTHTIPFIAWMVLLMGFEHSPTAGYLIRTLAGIALLLYCAPWRWYDRINPRNLPLAVGMGVLVFGIWVLMETRWIEEAAPALNHGYKVFAILMPWELPSPLTSTPYAPEICGWWMTGGRVFGSAVVIAVIEEFFWRGFLYRWMLGRNFLRVPMDQLHWPTLLMVSVVFAAAHDRWLVALLTGILYGWLVIRTRDIWAGCIAHGVTNFLLALYVLAEGRYEFW
jgi:CAAX prenyl protease-like protein